MFQYGYLRKSEIFHDDYYYQKLGLPISELKGEGRFLYVGQSPHGTELAFIKDKWDKIIGRREMESNVFKMLLIIRGHPLMKSAKNSHFLIPSPQVHYRPN